MFPEDVSAAKKELRLVMKERLKSLNVDRKAVSARLYANLITLEKIKSAQTVAVFIDFGAEIPTRYFIRQLFEAKEFTRIIGVPFCEQGEMFFYKLRRPTLDGQSGAPIFDDLTPMTFGILEPRPGLRNVPENLVAPEEFDVVLTPGLAFDLHGRRLGRGAGFYDRFLMKLRRDAFVVGICYEEQIVEHTPVAAHDFHVHALATPDRVVVINDVETTLSQRDLSH